MTIDALPAAPAPTDSRATFSAKCFAWVAALVAFVTQMNAAIADILGWSTSAQASAQSAAASAAAAQALAGAVAFNAATAYAQYQAAISTVNLLTYRRKTAGTSATDPSADSANWVNTGLPPVVLVRTGVNFAAVAGTVYILTANDVQMTLPAAPGAQDFVWYRLGTGVTRAVLKGNGLNIEGQSADVNVDLAGFRGRLFYNATDGWMHI